MRLYVGLRTPKRITILGQELAGEIDAVGRKVTRFKIGDPIFSPTLLRLGAYAENKCLPETYPVIKPANITYEEAATIPTGGINGLHFLKVADVHAGQTVLINGAGGSIGTYAVQIAKYLGAEVDVVDSAEKLAMLFSIGADHTIDYTQEDFTKSGKTYDVIIDVVGKSSFSGCVRSLNPNGRYILGNPGFLGIIRARWTPMKSGKKAIFAVASYKTEYYTFLKELIEAGKIKPIINKRYSLEQTSKAQQYVEEGHKKGNVVNTVAPDTKTQSTDI